MVLRQRQKASTDTIGTIKTPQLYFSESAYTSQQIFKSIVECILVGHSLYTQFNRPFPFCRSESGWQDQPRHATMHHAQGIGKAENNVASCMGHLRCSKIASEVIGCELNQATKK